MENKMLIYNQHEENTSWISGLTFYQEDLLFLEKQLAEVANKYTNTDVLSQVEHYQNQFIIQRNNMDEILHSIKINEDKLIAEVNKNPIAVDHRSTPYHNEEKELYISFEKSFKQLRSEFISFLAKWM